MKGKQMNFFNPRELRVGMPEYKRTHRPFCTIKNCPINLSPGRPFPEKCHTCEQHFLQLIDMPVKKEEAIDM